MKFVATKKDKTTDLFFPPLFCCCLIRDPNRKISGSGIRDEHLRSATLQKNIHKVSSGHQFFIICLPGPGKAEGQSETRLHEGDSLGQRAGYRQVLHALNKNLPTVFRPLQTNSKVA